MSEQTTDGSALRARLDALESEVARLREALDMIGDLARLAARGAAEEGADDRPRPR